MTVASSPRSGTSPIQLGACEARVSAVGTGRRVALGAAAGAHGVLRQLDQRTPRAALRRLGGRLRHGHRKVGRRGENGRRSAHRRLIRWRLPGQTARFARMPAAPWPTTSGRESVFPVPDGRPPPQVFDNRHFAWLRRCGRGLATFAHVRPVYLLALPALATLLAACTETPSYLPPCVDPSAPCAPYDAGTDAEAGLADAPVDAPTDAPAETGADAAIDDAASEPIEPTGSDAAADAAGADR
jgi:hypothetical protein